MKEGQERMRAVTPTLVLTWVLLAMAGCTPFRPGLPGEPLPPAAGAAAARGTGDWIAQTALHYVGVPYRFGGTDPKNGFDCSGLVSYVHGLDDIAVPRTAAEQFAGARRVSEADLQPGDLVFFSVKPGSHAVTHVGIYTGQRRFVHAPQTGRNVGVSSLDDNYYRTRFAGSGRYYDIPDSRPHRASAPRSVLR